MGSRHFGVGAEATYGTADTVDHFYEALTESLKLERNFESLEVVRQFSPVDVIELNRAVRGDAELLANYDGIGLLLEHLIGSVDTVTETPSAGFNEHTFPASGGIPAADRIGKSLTGEMRRDTSLIWTYTGLKIISWSQSFAVDQVSRLTLGFLGKGESTSTGGATTPSWPTILPLVPKQVNVAFDGTNLDARNASIEVENPVDEPFLLGSADLGKEPDRNGVLRVTGSAEILFDDFTQYAKFDGSTNVTVSFSAVNGTYSLTFLMTKCRLTQATPALSGRERLVATYEWESFYNTAATENLQAVLVNGDATP